MVYLYPILKMKAIFVVVVLLFGSTSAKPNPAKRSNLTCKNFPKQVSGRLYMMTVTDSGSTVTELKFNMDTDLQIAQMESPAQESFNILTDYKGGKQYISYPKGCSISDVKDKFPLPPPPEELSKLKSESSGVLGLNGASVNLYSYSNEEGKGMFTFQGDDSCLPVSFADQSEGSASAGSFLDVKTTADPEKLKIPINCEGGDFRRSFPGMVHAVHLKEAMMRRWPWPRASSKKRGFPSIDAAINSQKRGFPWIEILNNRGKRGFPWPLQIG